MEICISWFGCKAGWTITNPWLYEATLLAIILSPVISIFRPWFSWNSYLIPEDELVFSSETSSSPAIGISEISASNTISRLSWSGAFGSGDVGTLRLVTWTLEQDPPSSTTTCRPSGSWGKLSAISSPLMKALSELSWVSKKPIRSPILNQFKFGAKSWISLPFQCSSLPI